MCDTLAASEWPVDLSFGASDRPIRVAPPPERAGAEGVGLVRLQASCSNAKPTTEHDMKMRILGTMVSAAALLLVAATPADAQRTAEHSGYWISFGFGGGTAFGDDAFSGDSKFGGAGFLRMGGSVSQQLLLGGDLIGWGTDQDGVQIGRGAMMFTALYYPSPKGGFYVKGGAGFAGRTTEFEVQVGDVTATVTDDQGGVGLGAGLGFDIQLARNFFLTPALDFVYTGTEGDGASLLLFTVGATWH